MLSRLEPTGAESLGFETEKYGINFFVCFYASYLLVVCAYDNHLTQIEIVDVIILYFKKDRDCISSRKCFFGEVAILLLVIV